MKDYKLDKCLNLKTNKETETGLPNSNVLYYELEKDGDLCDIAPTLLDIMGIEKPQEMSGKSMIKH